MRSFVVTVFIWAWFLTFGFSPDLRAESSDDEEFPEPEPKAFFYGQFLFGQSIAAGKSSPGVGYMAAIGSDFVLPRGAWKRIEVGFEVGTGGTSFKKKRGNQGSAKVPVNFYALAKVGSGYSLGEELFAVWRLTAGPAWVDYEEKVGGVKYTASDSILGFMGGLEVDITAPFSNDLELVGGFVLRNLAINVDQVVASDAKANLNETFQINVPALRFGVRKAF